MSFLRLTAWSSGYKHCNVEDSEVSCYDIVTAAAALQEWEKTIPTSKSVGYVWVNVDGKPLADRMSMLYHGLQIAASTNRKLFVDRSRFAPLELPTAIEHSKSSMTGQEVRTDHTIVCKDISDQRPKVLFQ
jgi:hypothetical protein